MSASLGSMRSTVGLGWLEEMESYERENTPSAVAMLDDRPDTPPPPNTPPLADIPPTQPRAARATTTASTARRTSPPPTQLEALAATEGRDALLALALRQIQLANHQTRLAHEQNRVLAHRLCRMTAKLERTLAALERERTRNAKPRVWRPRTDTAPEPSDAGAD